MASIQNKLLLNLGVFRASTVRAAIGQFSANYPTTGASVTTANVTLAAGQTHSFSIPSSSQPSSCLVVHTSQPLRVDAELDAFSVTDATGNTTVARPASSMVFNVRSLLVIDDAVTSLVLENVGTASAIVTIHQG